MVLTHLWLFSVELSVLHWTLQTHKPKEINPTCCKTKQNVWICEIGVTQLDRLKTNSNEIVFLGSSGIFGLWKTQIKKRFKQNIKHTFAKEPLNEWKIDRTLSEHQFVFQIPPLTAQNSALRQQRLAAVITGRQCADWDGLGGHLTSAQNWWEQPIGKEAPTQMPLFESGNLDGSFPPLLWFTGLLRFSDRGTHSGFQTADYNQIQGMFLMWRKLNLHGKKFICELFSLKKNLHWFDSAELFLICQNHLVLTNWF